MNSELNPYQAPTAPILSGPGIADSTEAWRDGNLLVTRRKATLPPYCVKCAAPLDRPLKKKRMEWAPPWIYLLLLLNILILLVVYLIVRKSGELHMGLCAYHRKRRALWILTAWAIALLSLGSIPIAITTELAAWLIAIPVGIIAAAIIGTTGGRTLSPKKIDEHTMVFKGAGLPFLALLPDVNMPFAPPNPWVEIKKEPPLDDLEVV